MAWVVCCKDNSEWIHEFKPYRTHSYQSEELYGSSRASEEDVFMSDGDFIPLPKGSIKKLIGRDLTWEDNPVELK